jgi:hypothetical protein
MSSYQLPALYQVFYSLSLDTCLSAEYLIYPAHDTVTESEILRIRDVLTRKIIWSQVYTPAIKYWDAYSILDAQIAVIN